MTLQVTALPMLLVLIIMANPGGCYFELTPLSILLSFLSDLHSQPNKGVKNHNGFGQDGLAPDGDPQLNMSVDFDC